MKKTLLVLFVTFLLIAPTTLAIGLSYTHKTVSTTIAEDSIDYNIWISGDEGDNISYSFDFDAEGQHIDDSYIIPSDGIKKITQSITVPDEVGTYHPEFTIKQVGSGDGQSSISSEIKHTVNLDVAEATVTCEDLDCGEDSYTDWVRFCDGDVLKKRRTYYDVGCENAECFNDSTEQIGFVESCQDVCEDGECVSDGSDGSSGGYDGDDDTDEDTTDETNDDTTDDTTNETVTNDTENQTDNTTDSSEGGEKITTLFELRQVVEEKSEFVSIAEDMGYSKSAINDFLKNYPFVGEDTKKSGGGIWFWVIITLLGIGSAVFFYLSFIRKGNIKL